MIDCLVRYYIRGVQRRIIRFERVAKFPAVPFPGSQLQVAGDNLEVERVEFVEGSLPILVPEIDCIIEDMQEQGWLVASDTGHRP